MKDVFYELSLELTGQTELRKDSAKYYYKLLKENYPSDFIGLLNDYKNTKKILNKYKSISLVIIYLWYTAELVPNSKIQDFLNSDPSKKFYNSEQELKEPTHYYNALIWKAAHTHAKGLTGGYFGHWKYRPEN